MSPNPRPRPVATVFIVAPRSWPTESIPMAVALAEAGYAPICPLTNLLNPGRLGMDELEALNLALLRQSDAVMLLSYWQESPSAVRQREAACACQIPVFERLADLKADPRLPRQSVLAVDLVEAAS